MVAQQVRLLSYMNLFGTEKWMDETHVLIITSIMLKWIEQETVDC